MQIVSIVLNVKAYFLKNKKRIFQNVVWWKFYSECYALSLPKVVSSSGKREVKALNVDDRLALTASSITLSDFRRKKFSQNKEMVIKINQAKLDKIHKQWPCVLRKSLEATQYRYYKLTLKVIFSGSYSSPVLCTYPCLSFLHHFPVFTRINISSSLIT